ncbi:MAG: glucose/galactose MFS transporter [Bacteroidetes bacterium RBG_13_46_8]|nr:MAG: glucose/galactose MFS transporter [Bacteroidetes bacterium RBG_13_46_8]
MTTGSRSSKSNYVLSIAIIGGFFFIFGFVTWLNGILIPYFKISCELTDFEALIVAFSFYISYTIMALPAAWLLKRTGFKNGMMAGLMVMAVGTLVFVPAAITRTYALFLTGLFIMGTGLAVLQTASNPYITILGPRETAAVRISIMGICNKLAGAIAPLILAYFILNDGDAFIKNLEGLNDAARNTALDSLARRVINPYLVMSGVLFLLGLLVKFSPLPEIDMEPEQEDADRSAKTSILQFPHLIMGVVALFFYVGAEVIAGDTIIRYGLALGIPLESAKYFTSMVLIAMIVGYSAGIMLIPKVISQRTALLGCALLGIVFSLLALFVPAGLQLNMPFIDLMTFSKVTITIPLTVLFIALLGLANALVWPAIWPLAIHNLGGFIKTGTALLIMAIAGGALLPLLWGKLSDTLGSQLAYVILLPCYLIILYYAVRGYKLKTWK